MTRALHILALAFAIVGAGPLAVNAQGVNPAAIAGLEGKHPSEYFRQAEILFAKGRRDDAVFAFYFGQLRYRTYLLGRPDLPKDKDRAVFAALTEQVGEPINQYAFGDIPRLGRCIDAVLAHGRKTRDLVTPPEAYADAHASARAGLLKFKQTMLANRAQLKAQRTKNGLENRS